MKQTFSNRFKQLRKQKNLSQEQVASALGVSTQAVSKWECAQSYPDVELLPELADLLETTIDALLRDTPCKPATAPCSLPHDDVLRILQCKGQTVLTCNTYDPQVVIPLKIGQVADKTVHVEVWGSASIDGDVTGNLNAGDGVNCGNIGGNVNAGDGINCGNVGGSISAGDSVSCGNVTGSVDAGDGVKCGDVSGNVTAGDSVTCKNVTGWVSASGDVIIKN